MVIHIQSVDDPFRGPAAAARAFRVLRLLEAMGLLGREPVERLDAATIRRAARAAASAGIGQDVAPLLGQRGRIDPATIDVALGRLEEALEDSPFPRSELGELLRVFEIEQLARLAGASPVSLRRYGAGARPAPDAIATRLHWLAKVVADLRGAYNEAGIRRWFERRRGQLGDRSPDELLAGAWDPDDPGPAAIRQLARSLGGGGAT